MLEQSAKKLQESMRMNAPRKRPEVHSLDDSDTDMCSVKHKLTYSSSDDSEQGKSATLKYDSESDKSSNNNSEVSHYGFEDRNDACFTQWKNPAGKADGYVTGLEPATSYPNSRKYERKKGRVINLKGGESRITTLVIDNLDTKKAIREVEAEIKQIQKTVKAKVHPNPISKFSDV